MTGGKFAKFPSSLLTSAIKSDINRLNPKERNHEMRYRQKPDRVATVKLSRDASDALWSVAGTGKPHKTADLASRAVLAYVSAMKSAPPPVVVAGQLQKEEAYE